MSHASSIATLDRALHRPSPAWGTLVPTLGTRCRMPAEWEPHEATWLGWPAYVPELADEWHQLAGTLAEIVRVLHVRERVEILCPDTDVRARARAHLGALRVNTSGYRLHVLPSEHVWMRDIVPAAVLTDDSELELLHWHRRLWRDTESHPYDSRVGNFVERVTGLRRAEPQRPDGCGRIALDGGAVDVDGAGLLLATEQHLLSDRLVHNPGFDRDDYERVFRQYLGADRTIWLGPGCAGDMTNGHVDNVARFVAPGVVVLAYEEDPEDANHKRSADNLRRLELAGANDGRLRVVTLPFPRALAKQAARLPASYANFYIANGVVLVPTFDDPNDRIVQETLAELMPDRQIVGIPALQLLLGFGTLHCLTREIPSRTTS